MNESFHELRNWKDYKKHSEIIRSNLYMYPNYLCSSKCYDNMYDELWMSDRLLYNVVFCLPTGWYEKEQVNVVLFFCESKIHFIISAATENNIPWQSYSFIVFFSMLLALKLYKHARSHYTSEFIVVLFVVQRIHHYHNSSV